MITPALLEIADDAKMRGAPKEVFLYLHKILPLGVPEPLKLWPIAQALKMDKATVGRAMKRLVEGGYVQQGERERPGGRKYLIRSARRY